MVKLFLNLFSLIANFGLTQNLYLIFLSIVIYKKIGDFRIYEFIISTV